MKKRTAVRPTQVLLYGFTGVTLHTLEYFFNVKKVGQYQLVNDISYADWCIFNADQPQTKEVLHKLFIRKINKPSIVLSIKPLMWENTTTLLKPYTSQTLEDAIKEVESLVADEKKRILDAQNLIKANAEPVASAGVDELTTNNPSDVEPQKTTDVSLETLSLDENLVEGHVDKGREKSSKVASLILAAQKRKARLAAEEEHLSVSTSQHTDIEVTSPSSNVPNSSSQHDVSSPLRRTSLLPDPRVGSVRAQVVARLSAQEVNEEDLSVEIPLLLNETVLPESKPLADKPAVKTPLTAEKKAILLAKKAEILKKLEAAKANIKAKPLEMEPSAVAQVTPAIKAELDPSTSLLLTPSSSKSTKPQDTKKPAKDANSLALNTKTLFGHLPNLDWTSTADKRRMSLNLDGMLLPWLSKAIQQGKAKQAACKIAGTHVHLEYLPWTDCFICDGDDDLLNAMMSSRFSVGELGVEEGTTTEAELFDGLGTEYRTVSAEDLLWLSGLWTSHGRVLPNDDPTRTRKLSYSPECARELQIPELHAILKIWQSRPMSAFQVIDELEMPQRYVFGAMAACTSAGLFKY